MNEMYMRMIMRGRWRLAAGAACAVLGAALNACSELDLGSPPNTYIGPMQNMAPPPAPVPADSTATQPGTMPAMTQFAAGPTTMQAATRQFSQFSDGTPLEVTLKDAILTAIENNPSLQVQRINPQISRTTEEVQRAAFDPTLTGNVSGGRTVGLTNTHDRNSPSNSTDSIHSDVGYQQFLPTGTTVSANGTVDYTTQSFYTDSGLVTTGLATTITQSLLRGGDMQANLASLREAQVDTKISQYELRGFAESLVASLENAFWDYALALRQIAIYEASLQLAEDQLAQTNTLIAVGRLADVERAAAEAEVALRRENLINARSNVEKTRLHLLQLMGPKVPVQSSYWRRPVTVREDVAVGVGTLDDVEAHVNVALALRPDLNQARLQIQRGDLEIVRTKNGLLPQMDLFVTLGKTGYAKSFGGSIEDLNGPSYAAFAGLKMSYPPENRAAQAQFQRAKLTKDQAVESLENLVQLAQVDVRDAYIEVTRAREQIAATTATRIAQEASFRNESAKLAVGRSTTLLVAQAQRNLLQAQIDEVSARATYLKGLVALYQVEGTLLERRRIAAPGRTPVKGPAK